MKPPTQGHALILAAGMGTRMKSSLSKVLHPLVGRTMVGHVVASAKAVGLQPVVVVHHQEDAVRAALAESGAMFVRQEHTRGTGDAVASTLSVLPKEGTVVVMAGDAPLLRPSTIEKLLQCHGDAAVTVLTVCLDDGAHYGRLERDGEGAALRIVEAREASPEQLALTEINTGLYCFDVAWLREVLPTLQPHAHKDEIYLTDTIEIAAQQGRVRVVIHDDFSEVQGVNDRWELSGARQVLQRRIIEGHARAGVDFIAPHTNVVGVDVVVGQDVSIGLGSVLEGTTKIGAGTQVGPHCHVINTVIGTCVNLHSHSVCEDAKIEDGSSVGPFARLRPMAHVGTGAKVGNFVEMKKATLGAGAKINHLSYVGDAVIGESANVGAGTITCNYDGFSKHKTTIGAGAFIGSNTALVAPVSVGQGAIVGAGSVITKDVPQDAVSVARGKQIDRLDAAARFRSRKKS
ncbi:MAG: UDP-N-acetylglucosamine diphosphorylase/glucosamine-1-phosphate N-acetyltransferase [Deltaproteobacteria bacterium]|nr:UDP-N-acetylglucosamine diphosphorylase/glucosamine-1-phosphate N-acetyltransferase [Deltaproteobacteria bacterium]